MFEDVVTTLPSPTTLAIAAGVVLFGGIIRGFVGFGGALMTIPTMAVIFTPKEAVALHMMMEIPSTFQLMPIGFKYCSRQTVVPPLIAMILATPFGAFALASLDPQPMRIALSIFVIVMVTLMFRDWRYPGEIGPGVLSVAGAVGGFVQGSTGMGGPPLAAILLSRKDDNDTIRGNLMLLMGSLVLVAVPIQWYFDIITKKTIVLGLAAGVIYVMATILGARLYVYAGQKVYRQIALAILGLIGVWSLYTSVT